MRTMDTSNLSELALRVRELRARTGMSQEKFGDYLYGVPKMTIQSWERGIRECPNYLMRLIEEKIDRDYPIKEEKE